MLAASQASAHLVVDVAISVSPVPFVAKSSSFTYTIYATDLAYDAAYGIVVTDELPPGMKVSLVSGTGWNCSQTSSAITCSAETLSPGTSAILVHATAPPAAGPITNNLRVESIGSLDPVSSNDTASQTIVVYDPGTCSTGSPSLLAPADGATLSDGLVALTWSAVAGATTYRVWAAVEGALPAVIAETTDARLLRNAEIGGTEWWVEAVFNGCPPNPSAHAHYYSNGQPAAFLVSDYAGQPGVGGTADGPLATATFESPASLGVDSYGNLYIADTAASTIRGIGADGNVRTIAGIANTTGASDASGQYATFNHPAALAVTPGGYVFIADSGNQLIRRLYPNGNGVVYGPWVATLAGATGAIGLADGLGATARFHSPAGIAVAPNYLTTIADTGNNRLRSLVQSSVMVSSLSTSTPLQGPTGVALDSAGNIYVADTGNDTIDRIGTDGSVTTLAGGPGAPGFHDGVGVAARFNRPTALAFDSLGNLYVADSGNHAIRRIAPSSLVTTIIGTGFAGHLNGAGSTATLNAPSGIAFDGAGRLFIADAANNVVRLATVTTLPAVQTAQPKRRAVHH
jgi:sugar lactone lactonase YvrE